MAVKKARASGHRSVWHLLVRLLGATGLLLAGVGLTAYAATDQDWGLKLAMGSAIAVALALLVEVRVIVAMAFSRRGALGLNVFLQIVLAAALLAGINAFSLFYYQRFDLTRDREFTIPNDVQQQLSRLSGETQIVLFQRHTSFGQLADKQDNYDAAAERQIVAKVKDLVEQFQELGPRFHVETLDIQSDSYQEKLAALKEKTPELGKAIDEAPENSIFFHANGKVQRLSFHDIYELDKVASQKANNGRGNLVLVYQGIGPFARAALNLETKQPRVALAVIAGVLGMKSNDPKYGMAGAGKTLTTNGFLTRDIILKKWTRVAPPQADILTYDEGEFERLSEQIKRLNTNLKRMDEGLAEMREERKLWADSSLEKLNKQFTIVINPLGAFIAPVEKVEEVKKSGRKVNTAKIEQEHRQQFLENHDIEIKNLETIIASQRQQLDEINQEKSKLKVENLAEQRRITDLKAKFARLLADCDLLVLPRMTLYDVTEPEYIPNRIHRIDEAQWRAIQDFMRAGKPVLFCLGPENEPPEGFDPRDTSTDLVEEALVELGFQLPKQTILFNSESKALGERRTGFLLLGAPVAVPPVLFDWPKGLSQGRPVAGIPELERNPIRVSLELAARSAGHESLMDLRLRHPRPVYFEPGGDEKLKVDPVFMMTSPEAWNEAQPFPGDNYVPSFDPKKKDPDKGKVQEKRIGYFPIGLAVDAKLPGSWKTSDQTGADALRVAVIGHGGIFLGPTLSPAREKALLDVCNWLLGRDDLLAKDNQTWQLPRVELTRDEFQLWHWGTRWEAVFFAFLGLVVWMVRRMR
jgi:hypothetical protein